MPSDVARSNDARALVANLDSGPQYGKNDKIIYATDYSGRSSASSSARLKDVADSYLRQLHGGNTAARVLAAQGLGSLPSFLGPTQGADALRRAIELGVLGGLIDVLMMDDKMPVQVRWRWLRSPSGTTGLVCYVEPCRSPCSVAIT
ncbi:hypothetical protein Vretimale_19979 [Volvox reticuliferus]|uniref:Uncharacterized protein n=1 Tax=Volvox reticuliferus TaxID=1737510 RepID=A0A8J4GZZ3_9CHLO|nr:hypothetical protein Vretimale_19979 [Volvox reticuliferus]